MSIFLTHLHNDHKPFRFALIGTRIKFVVAEELYDAVTKEYGDIAEVEIWKDTLKLEHMFIAGGVHKSTWTYGYFGDRDTLILPECIKPKTTLREYRPRMSLTFCARQSHNQILEPFSNNDPDIDFLIDNKVWNPYKPNVVPKRIYATIPVDIQKFQKERGNVIRNPFRKSIF